MSNLSRGECPRTPTAVWSCFRLWLSKKKATNGLQPNCQSIPCVELTEDGVDLGKISSLLPYKSGVNLRTELLSAMRQIWCAQKEFKQRFVHALSDWSNGTALSVLLSILPVRIQIGIYRRLFHRVKTNILKQLNHDVRGWHSDLSVIHIHLGHWT